MNRAELKQVVAEEGLGAVAFLDEEKVRPDAVVLEPRPDGWAVYLTTERAGAVASTVRTFESEADALDHVLVKLRQGEHAAQAMSEVRGGRGGPSYTMGEKVIPTVKTRENDEDNLYGPGWRAVRTADGWVLSWDGGGIQTRIVRVAISDAEFELLRDDPAAFSGMALEHDPNRGAPAAQPPADRALADLRETLEEIRQFLAEHGLSRDWAKVSVLAAMAAVDDEPADEVLRDIWWERHRTWGRRDGFDEVYVAGAGGGADRVASARLDQLRDRLRNIVSRWGPEPD